MIRGLIFDFDGLILETEEPIFQSWQELYQELGCQLPFEKWATIIGTSDDNFDPVIELERQLGYKIENLANLLDKRLKRELEILSTRSIQPGVSSYLSQAQSLGLKIGLASCSSAKWVRGHLERLGITDYFGFIHTGEIVNNLKPHPEIYHKLLADMRLLAEETIAFEDSPPGVTAAKLAGLFCVAVLNPMTAKMQFEHGDLFLNSLEDLPLQHLIELAKNHYRTTR